MDRGFLFGDGVYEVIPSYQGQFVALDYHLERLRNSLEGIHLAINQSNDQLVALLNEVCRQNGNGDQGVYLQITRGVAEKRQHAFSAESTPTIFAYPFPIASPADGSPNNATCFTAVTRKDKRWARCDIKSTALLGNVLHMMEAVDDGAQEVLLFNEKDELTEAAACNVFVVSTGKILTPALDHHILPGVTRRLCLEFIAAYTDWSVEIRPVTRAEVCSAAEIWLSSSTKELAPVIQIDGKPVGSGKPGPLWSQAQQLFHLHRFDH
jgi:D-alanine transaminase